MIRFVPGNWRGTYCGRQKIGLRMIAITPAILLKCHIFIKNIGSPQRFFK